jgi:hypothetical protein
MKHTKCIAIILIILAAAAIVMYRHHTICNQNDTQNDNVKIQYYTLNGGPKCTGNICPA